MVDETVAVVLVSVAEVVLTDVVVFVFVIAVAVAVVVVADVVVMVVVVAVAVSVCEVVETVAVTVEVQFCPHIMGQRCRTSDPSSLSNSQSSRSKWEPQASDSVRLKQS